MAKNYDPAKLAAAWASGMSGAGTKYTAGVMAYDGNPGDAAVANRAGMVANFNAATQPGGKWERNVVAGGRIWKTNASTIGATNLATGAQKGSPKMQRYFAAAGTVIAQMVQEVRALNPTDKKARMNWWFDNAKARLTGLGKS